MNSLTVSVCYCSDASPSMLQYTSELKKYSRNTVYFFCINFLLNIRPLFCDGITDGNHDHNGNFYLKFYPEVRLYNCIPNGTQSENFMSPDFYMNTHVCVKICETEGFDGRGGQIHFFYT